MADEYEVWLDQVRDALRSINTGIEDWQGVWLFDFSGEHDVGTTRRLRCPADAVLSRRYLHDANCGGMFDTSQTSKRFSDGSSLLKKPRYLSADPVSTTSLHPLPRPSNGHA